MTITENPAMGRVYRHVCQRCGERRDHPIRDNPPRWRRRAV